MKVYIVVWDLYNSGGKGGVETHKVFYTKKAAKKCVKTIKESDTLGLPYIETHHVLLSEEEDDE